MNEQDMMQKLKSDPRAFKSVMQSADGRALLGMLSGGDTAALGRAAQQAADGQGQQGQNGHHAVDQRRVEVLHGHRRQVRQQHAQHQLDGLQLADLALAGQAQPRDQQQIQDDGAEKSSGHEHSPFYGQYAPMRESYTEAIGPRPFDIQNAEPEKGGTPGKSHTKRHVPALPAG